MEGTVCSTDCEALWSRFMTIGWNSEGDVLLDNWGRRVHLSTPVSSSFAFFIVFCNTLFENKEIQWTIILKVRNLLRVCDFFISLFRLDVSNMFLIDLLILMNIKKNKCEKDTSHCFLEPKVTSSIWLICRTNESKAKDILFAII